MDKLIDTKEIYTICLNIIKNRAYDYRTTNPTEIDIAHGIIMDVLHDDEITFEQVKELSNFTNIKVLAINEYKNNPKYGNKENE